VTNINPKELYAVILLSANQFLHNSKHFSMEVLAEDNPTYQEVADVMQKLADIINILAVDFDPLMCAKAIDYCWIMKRMGMAIANQDQEALSELVNELDKRSFL